MLVCLSTLAAGSRDCLCACPHTICMRFCTTLSGVTAQRVNYASGNLGIMSWRSRFVATPLLTDGCRHVRVEAVAEHSLHGKTRGGSEYNVKC